MKTIVSSEKLWRKASQSQRRLMLSKHMGLLLADEYARLSWEILPVEVRTLIG